MKTQKSFLYIFFPLFVILAVYALAYILKELFALFYDNLCSCLPTCTDKSPLLSSVLVLQQCRLGGTYILMLDTYMLNVIVYISEMGKL